MTGVGITCSSIWEKIQYFECHGSSVSIIYISTCESLCVWHDIDGRGKSKRKSLIFTNKANEVILCEWIRWKPSKTHYDTCHLLQVNIVPKLKKWVYI